MQMCRRTRTKANQLRINRLTSKIGFISLLILSDEPIPKRNRSMNTIMIAANVANGFLYMIRRSVRAIGMIMDGMIRSSRLIV